MSRTLSGSPTGRAAVTEAREFRESLIAPVPASQMTTVLREVMGAGPFISWLASAPAYDDEFLRAVEAKLAEYPVHSVELASALDLPETDELAETLEMFGGQNMAPNLYDFTDIPKDMPIIDMDNIDEIPF